MNPTWVLVLATIVVGLYLIVGVFAMGFIRKIWKEFR